MALLQRTLATTAVAAALAGALTLPAWAQHTPSVQAAAPTTSATHAHPSKRTIDPAAMHAHRMERIKPLLQLTAAQEGAWKQFVEATAPVKKVGQRTAPQARQQLTTLERIDRAQQLRKERNQLMEQRENATKTFYTGLTAAQQKAFDALEPQLRKKGPRHQPMKKPGHGPAHFKGDRGSHPHHGQPAAPSTPAGS